MKNFCIIFFFLFIFTGLAQTTQDSVVVIDTLAKKKLPRDKAPRRAALLSAVIPGAGQIYNRRYWKPPIVWAGIGGFGYFFLKNQKLYTQYRDSLRTSVADTGSTPAAIDYYQKQKVINRKHRDLFGFGVIAMYVIQIIDANVDAHLRTFDVSDDLSLHIHAKPVFIGNAWGAGLSLRLTFK